MQWHAHTTTILEIQRKIHFCGKFGACFREIFVHMCMDVCLCGGLASCMRDEPEECGPSSSGGLCRSSTSSHSPTSLIPAKELVTIWASAWPIVLPTRRPAAYQRPAWMAGWLDGWFFLGCFLEIFASF